MYDIGGCDMRECNMGGCDMGGCHMGGCHMRGCIHTDMTCIGKCMCMENDVNFWLSSVQEMTVIEGASEQQRDVTPPPSGKVAV